MASHFLSASAVSFFSVVDVLTEGKGSPTVHRILSWIRKTLTYGVSRGTMIVETGDDVGPCYRSRETADKALSDRVGEERASDLAKILFFRTHIESYADVDKADNEDFLGYFAWRTFTLPPSLLAAGGHVFEAVLRLPPLPDRYYHMHGRFKSQVGSRTFEVPAVYFTEQDRITTVCAHAALANAINNAPRLVADHVITPEEVNKGLCFDHRSLEKRFRWYAADPNDHTAVELAQGEARITWRHMIKILEGYGLSSLRRDYTKWTNCDFEEFAYPMIESGCPVLLCFSTDVGRSDHVVVLLGHTYDSDSWLSQARQGYKNWVPELRRHQAWLWAPHFICSDDNLGPYYSMERTALKNPLLYDLSPTFRVSDIIGIVPKGVRRDPTDAEETAILWLRYLLRSRAEPPDEPEWRWLRRLLSAVASDSDPPVTRTLLVTKQQYESYLVQHASAEASAEVVSAVQDLPRLFWMTEISLVDLYSANACKLGEVLQSVEKPTWDPDDPTARDIREGFLLG